jgi:hypothetical protein
MEGEFGCDHDSEIGSGGGIHTKAIVAHARQPPSACEEGARARGGAFGRPDP